MCAQMSILLATFNEASLNPGPTTNPSADRFWYRILEVIYVPDEVWRRDCESVV